MKESWLDQGYCASIQSRFLHLWRLEISEMVYLVKSSILMCPIPSNRSCNNSPVVSLFVQMEIFLEPGPTDALWSLESFSYDSTFPIYHFWLGINVTGNPPKVCMKFIIFHSRDLGKMSKENTHLECKFLGHERTLGLEWPKNLHEWWVEYERHYEWWVE